MFTDKNINFAPYNKTKSFINQTITYIDMADEQVKKYIDKAKNEMESSVVFLDESLAHIRAGRLIRRYSTALR